jgi:nucleotide-binding universal stress UspA family protein
MRAVLVGSDLGPRSDAVVRGAAALALGSGAALHVVHALGMVGMPLREAVAALETGADRRARGALDEQLRRVLGKGSDPALPAVDFRCAPAALLERARELDPGVVVVGAGSSDAAEDPAGTPFRVAARSARPVLVLRGPLHWPPRSVLYAAEEPGASGDDLRHACDWLRRACPPPSPRKPPMELLVLHAAQGPRAPPDGAAALAREARRAGHRQLRVTGIRDPRHGRPPATPAGHVLDWAGRMAPDLLLLHRHPGDPAPVRERAWYQALLRSPCPVCLLPGSGEPAARWEDPARERAPEDDGVLAAG